MTNQANEKRHLPRWLIWLFLGVLLLLGILLLLSLGRAGERPLKPFRSSPTPGTVVVDGQPLLVTFAQLNEDPSSFHGKRIRVTGDYTLLPPPACPLYNGHGARWALIADNLQLDATGFEQILRLLPPGASLTVDGVWRLYRGPLGCGKGAPDGIAWYLEVEQIVQPNPFPIAGSTPGANEPPPGDAGTPASQPTTTPGAPEATAATPGQPSPTPDPAATGAFTPTPTVAADASPTKTPTVNSAIPTSTPPPLTTTTTPTVDATAPTLTNTATAQPDGTPTPTPTITQTPTPGPTQPVLPTATPGDGYPGPNPTGTATVTPTPTATTAPYP